MKAVVVLEQLKSKNDSGQDLKYHMLKEKQKLCVFGILKKQINGFLKLESKQHWQLLANESIFTEVSHENHSEIFVSLIQDSILNFIE